MEVVEKFITNLVEDMEDNQWSIVGIVEVEEFEDEGKIFGRVQGDKHVYDKQDDEFIKQWTGHLGDDFSGFILKPMGGNKYVKINYSC